MYRNDADYVRARLYEKTAPRIESILANDSGEGLYGLPVPLRMDVAPVERTGKKGTPLPAGSSVGKGEGAP